jgi:replicative DNA helicase
VSEVRTPPHSTEAEQSLLGALLLDNQAWERIADVVSSRDFYKGSHRVIYEHIELVLAADQPADVVTVSQSLSEAQVLDQVGGAVYLGEIAQATPSAVNVRRYAELVREKAIQRNLIRVCSEVMERALQPGVQSVDELLEEAERKLFALRERRMVKKAYTFKELLSKVFEQIDHRYHSDNKEITGISTGYAKLDEMTAGFQPGDLIVIAGRPSMGKTALAMNIAEHVGLELALPVAVFSIEMADVQLVQRMLGSVGRVDQHKLRTGNLNDSDWARLSNAMGRMHDSPFMIEETSSLTIVELRARARRIARENPKLGLVIVDYLQLMATHGQSQSERTSEIGEISRGLKALAKELNVPVIAISQLNRGVEARVNKRPMNSDLRDSGSIEQDADLIVHMYREEVYVEDSPTRGYAEAIVGKQRNGAIGTVFLRFVKEETRFEDTTWTPPKRERKAKKGFVSQMEKDAAERSTQEQT